MSGIKVIENKISSAKKYLKILKRYHSYKKEEIEENIDIRGAVELVKMVGFRNIITHDYDKIDYDILYNVLKKGRKDIESLLKSIEKKLHLKRTDSAD